MSENNPTNPPASDSKTVKARVLVDTTIGDQTFKPNDIVSLNPKAAAALGAQVDTDPAAVKYAEGLKRKAKSEDEEA